MRHSLPWSCPPQDCARCPHLLAHPEAGSQGPRPRGGGWSGGGLPTLLGSSQQAHRELTWAGYRGCVHAAFAAPGSVPTKWVSPSLFPFSDKETEA